MEEIGTLQEVMISLSAAASASPKDETALEKRDRYEVQHARFRNSLSAIFRGKTVVLMVFGDSMSEWIQDVQDRAMDIVNYTTDTESVDKVEKEAVWSDY
jgi:hypothetical protein